MSRFDLSIMFVYRIEIKGYILLPVKYVLQLVLQKFC